jgi:hypothetical protein
MVEKARKLLLSVDGGRETLLVDARIWKAIQATPYITIQYITSFGASLMPVGLHDMSAARMTTVHPGPRCMECRVRHPTDESRKGRLSVGGL